VAAITGRRSSTCSFTFNFPDKLKALRIIQFPTTFVQFPRQTESVDTMGGWQAELIKGLSLYIDTAFTMMLV
jgi:hypothetical protein